MQNLTPDTPAPQYVHADHPTPSQELQHAGSLVERAAAAVADEFTEHLDWSARDRIARALHSAQQIIRAHAPKQTFALASCLFCGTVEQGALIAADQCPTCLYDLEVAH